MIEYAIIQPVKQRIKSILCISLWYICLLEAVYMAYTRNIDLADRSRRERDPAASLAAQEKAGRKDGEEPGKADLSALEPLPKCPSCGEHLKFRAKKCGNCGFML
jgi:hypothetical protein